MKELVAFFSPGGATDDVAREISSLADCDLFVIKPEVPYSEEDLDWMVSSSRSSKEQKEEGCRPAIKNTVKDFDSYEQIYLGFPIWWYREPRIIDTFLESYDFTGKRIIPFCTSDGSDMDKISRLIAALVPTAQVEKGARLTSRLKAESFLKQYR